MDDGYLDGNVSWIINQKSMYRIQLCYVQVYIGIIIDDDDDDYVNSRGNLVNHIKQG